MGEVRVIMVNKNGASLTKINILTAKIGLDQAAFACSKLTIETLEQGVKYVSS